MTKDVADTISESLQKAGYDHARFITGDQHRIEITRNTFDGQDLIALVQILAPTGSPIPGIGAQIETGRSALVIS